MNARQIIDIPGGRGNGGKPAPAPTPAAVAKK